MFRLKRSSGCVLFEGFEFVVFAVFVMTCSSDEGLRFLCDVALPVSASISCWVGGVDVLEAVLSFGRGLVFSGFVAGVVFTEVNFWSRVLSLLLATGFWLMTVSVVVFAVVCI